MSNTAIEIDKQTALSLYRTMQIIRQCEERLAQSHQQGLVHGACHTYVGQEAIASAVFAHLRQSDVVFSTHRGHGHALAKGLHPRELIAELYGRETGCSQGRGGSMHLFKPEIGMMGTSGIVGPCILQACGGGYTFKIQQSDNVAVSCFGDGAVNNGAFHEGLNMASIWNLPCIFVCENNQFATEVPFSYSSGIPDVGRRAENYGIPGFEVDGNDVLAIYQVAGEAIARAREQQGPTLIECKTYRTRAHAEGMVDFTYRTKEDVENWKQKCPLIRLAERLVEQGLVTTDELNLVQQEITELIAESHEFAKDSPYPSGDTVMQHVYDESTDTHDALDRDPGTREISYAAATKEALDEAMATDPSIWVMGEGIGERGGNFTTTLGLYEKYGADRLCDTPICERGFVGLGCGAAMTGSRPVIDFMFIDFINDAFGEMINQIAKMQYMSSGRIQMPIVLRGCGGIGHSAATHHSGLYHSIYAHIPGLRVVTPATPYDAKGLFAHALKSNDPVLFLEHRELMTCKGPVPEEHYEIPFGKASVVREGTEVTVVAVALMVQHALAAAGQLSENGISVEVVDPRTVSPLDTHTICESVAKTGRLLIVDEAFQPCSIAAEIAAAVADQGFDSLDAPIKRLNGTFNPTPYAPTLENEVVPHVVDIVQAIQDLLEE
ncbi:MAG: dehydrogenase [Planctomycetaceae bacterium]|jgi:2-oxoisovalerate dehydrogenase E1 component|nr:dehydrogenase [Planctomycetaceae bacterium]MBT4845373.1 dehydrogenase [Planctomycetaceae bacterium]MBT5124406.1 dehydrogenase [Planctomycetaceae bacterium]MBT5598469.1 dehydrogenase [Planctomycetaceae bacterium]MBT5883314.1 dehydrogenase [Planctomycetaceae bacterium]